MDNKSNIFFRERIVLLEELDMSTAPFSRPKEASVALIGSTEQILDTG